MKRILMRVSILMLFGSGFLCGPMNPDGAAARERPEFSFSRQNAGAEQKELSIGPGQERFYFSGSGEWLGLFPNWYAGESVFETGGFVLLGENADGRTVELANTANGRLSGIKNVFWCKGAYEGIPGGSRLPAPNSDDDADGRIDEDRLDGVDNDGDGRIDEDFAAIGDEMAVVEYSTDSTDTGRKLLFHQECYAWSLPNINEMVMVNLKVQNTGAEPIKGVRLGAFFQAEGPLNYSERTVESPSGGMGREATVLQCDNGRAVLGLLFLPYEHNEDGSNWLHGAIKPQDGIVSGIVEPHLLPQPQYPRDMEEPALANRYKVLAGEEILVCGVSPNLGTLNPGQEMEISVALITSRTGEKMESAVVDGYRTFFGNGKNHFLPPLMTFTCHRLWGSYEKLDGPEAGVRVEIENAAVEGIRLENISFLSGLDMDQIQAPSSEGNNISFVYGGRIPNGLYDSSGRITLKGRLGSGDILEISLRPETDGSSGAYNSRAGAGMLKTAEEFWQHPGKISEELLKISPNPFRDATTIFYEVPSAVQAEDGSYIASDGPFAVNVKIYNVTGRLIGVLADESLGPGRYEAAWRAVDEKGIPIASGVYYVRLQIAKRHVTQRLILIK